MAYHSTGLNPAQRNYSAGEIECWAIIAASRKFRDYLKAACKVVFISDHNPLRWLRKQRDPRGKYARWIQELEGLDYEIRHVKGSNNAAADFLSRIECEIDDQVNNEYEYVDRFVYNLSQNGALLDEIRCEQLSDPAIAFAAKQLQEHGTVTKGRYRSQCLAVSNGVVTRANRILVPDSLRKLVLTQTHNVSHPGIRRTLHRLKQQFTWNGMHRDTQIFCKECNICYRGKSKTKSNEPLTPNSVANSPRQIVAYDVATLPWSGEQSRYFLLMTDLFSKWVELAPMRDQTSRSILTALNTSWINRHGPPEAFLSDQGPNVDGTEIRKALSELGVGKLRSSPYHPQGDGQAERNIQTVKQTLRCILADRELEKDCWPSILQEVAHTLNTLPPFHIMHAYQNLKTQTSVPHNACESNPLIQKLL